MPRHGARRSLATLLVIALAFIAGFGLAKLLDRSVASASAKGQGDRYAQVLNDLQRYYYKPLDVARLGHQGIVKLLAGLHDPYTVYFSPQQARQFDQALSGSYTGIGVSVDVKSGSLSVMQVFPGSPAAQAGIKPGDVIVAVDGKPTAGQTAAADVARITGPAGTAVHLQVQPAGTKRRESLTLTRRAISTPLTTARLINDHGTKVGYVSLSDFATGRASRGARRVTGLQKRGAQWIVFDLRNDGGGLVNEAVAVAGDFLPRQDRRHHARRSIPQRMSSPRPAVPRPASPGGAGQRQHRQRVRDRHRGAAGLPPRRRDRLPHVRQGRGPEVLPLSGGAQLKITIAAYRTPAGRDINHKGILPNIVVDQTGPGSGAAAHAGAGPARSAGGAAAKDPALARALRYILSGR